MKEQVSVCELSAKPRHECGICGVFGHQDAAKLAYFGLYALQHRGQESAGIVAGDGKKVVIHKEMGLVADVFSERVLQRLQGHLAVGHVRYSTTGESNIVNTQPFMVHHKGLSLSVAHNGNLVNSIALRRHLEQMGSIFQTTMDSEIVIHLMARHLDRGLQEAIKTTISCIQGAYSLLLMTQDTMIAVRDPNGFRPLCLGILDNGGYVVASETCALDLIEAEYLRDIEPGEVVIINEQGLTSLFPWAPVQKSFCIFEHVYFARPDSDVFGFNVYAARKRMGEILAREAKIEADFVMPFPDSGNYAAIGYSNASGIPLEMGMIRNHYVGRSRVQSLRQAGAAEIHMVVSCPPTRHACYYGIDFPSSSQLIAADNTVEGIRDYLGLDSLTYLSVEGMVEATGLSRDHFCLACYTGEYPIEPDKNFTKDAFTGCGC